MSNKTAYNPVPSHSITTNSSPVNMSQMSLFKKVNGKIGMNEDIKMNIIN